VKEFKYTTTFSSQLKCLVDKEKDALLAVASLKELSNFVPKGIDNSSLLPVAFNAFIANRVNKNGDCISSEEAVALAKSFPMSPINVEHKRNSVIGYVLNYTFTEFGTDKLITEEEALKSEAPFNVTLGGVLWRMVNRDLTDAVEEASDPASDTYQSISASWEVGFSEYSIAKIDGDSKNLKGAEIITNEEEIEKIKGYLKGLGGKGILPNGEKVYRKVIGKVIPLGIGLTETPAAEVGGVATPKTKEETEGTKASSASKSEETDQNKTKNISHKNENTVIIKEKAIAMSVKINKIEDITDDNLKQISASDMTEWVKSQIRDADKNFQAEKAKVDNELKASKEAHQKLIEEHDSLKKNMDKVSASLDELKKEKDARIKQDTFTKRMASLDGEFELVDAEREVIASEVTDLDDAGFENYKKKLNVLLAAKKKSVIEAKKKEQEEAAAKEKEAKKNNEPETAKASLKDEQTKAVEGAIEGGGKTKTTIPNTPSKEETTMEKFQKAFGVDQWVSDIKLTD